MGAEQQGALRAHDVMRPPSVTSYNLKIKLPRPAVKTADGSAGDVDGGALRQSTDHLTDGRRGQQRHRAAGLHAAAISVSGARGSHHPVDAFWSAWAIPYGRGSIVLRDDGGRG